jgi:hypothetical protein
MRRIAMPNGTEAAIGRSVSEHDKPKEPAMTPAITARHRRTAVEVKALLREIGYVMHVTRKLVAEMKAEEAEPVRPEMVELCAVEMAACAA